MSAASRIWEDAQQLASQMTAFFDGNPMEETQGWQPFSGVGHSIDTLLEVPSHSEVPPGQPHSQVPPQNPQVPPEQDSTIHIDDQSTEEAEDDPMCDDGCIEMQPDQRQFAIEEILNQWLTVAGSWTQRDDLKAQEAKDIDTFILDVTLLQSEMPLEGRDATFMAEFKRRLLQQNEKFFVMNEKACADAAARCSGGSASSNSEVMAQYDNKTKKPNDDDEKMELKRPKPTLEVSSSKSDSDFETVIFNRHKRLRTKTTTG